MASDWDVIYGKVIFESWCNLDDWKWVLPPSTVWSFYVTCTSRADGDGGWMRSFLGVGEPWYSTQFGSVRCPHGTRPIGVGARSSCAALSDMKASLDDLCICMWETPHASNFDLRPLCLSMLLHEDNWILGRIETRSLIIIIQTTQFTWLLCQCKSWTPRFQARIHVLTTVWC